MLTFIQWRCRQGYAVAYRGSRQAVISFYTGYVSYVAYVYVSHVSPYAGLPPDVFLQSGKLVFGWWTETGN